MPTKVYQNRPSDTGSGSAKPRPKPTQGSVCAPEDSQGESTSPPESEPDAAPSTASEPCLRCHGTYHYQDSTGAWRRCPCIIPVLDRTFIVPALRRQSTWSDAWLRESVVPLRSWTATGSLAHFKAKCWRSLIAYESQSLRYDYIRAERLLDAWLGKDLDYPGVEHFVGLPLLILELPDYTVPNKNFGDVLRRVYVGRRTEHRPTWAFIPGRIPLELQGLVSLVTL